MLCFLTVLPLSAATINIFNTGVLGGGTDSSGTGPIGVGAIDPHWQDVLNSSSGTNAFQAASCSNFSNCTSSGEPAGWPTPFTESGGGTGPWVASALSGTRSLSQWISSQSNVTALSGGLEYDFSETFDLTNFIASTAQLAGSFAADNSILGIFVNGVLVTGTANTGTSISKTAFNLLNGVNGVLFNAGINTITFKVQNVAGAAPNPSGLLVEFTTATATATGVPEPATLFGVGLGLSLVGLIYRRRRS